MLRKILPLLILIETAAFAGSSDAIQKIVDEDRLKYHLPALSISIYMPEQKKSIAYVSGAKITPDTLFQIGSLTKTFTASIVFQLIEKNKLNLNDRLIQFLPQYPRWGNITIENLLQHTSGIYNYTHGKDFDDLLRRSPQKIWSLNELAERAYQHADILPPMEKSVYSNTDYILLGMIIEKVTHHSLQQEFNQYFRKYHLNNTFYFSGQIPTNIKNRLIHGYNQDGTLQYNQDTMSINTSFGQSSGGIISTPNDISAWLNQLFSGKIITQKSLSTMTTIISEKTAQPIKIKLDNLSSGLNKAPWTEVGIASGMGLIYFRNVGLRWVHAGGTLGYEAFYAYNPCTGSSLVIMYNIKPRRQFIFINIGEDIFNILKDSQENCIKLKK